MEVDGWTGEETIVVKDVIAMLNEMHQLDPKLMTDMVLHRFPCNEGIKNHKTVQVHGDASVGAPKVGLLGVLNGILGIDRNHFGPVAAYFEKENGKLLGFKMTNTDGITKYLEEGDKC